MPSIRFRDGTGKVHTAPIYKRITSLGSSDDCDVVISGDDKILGSHAQILFDGTKFTLTALERRASLQVNGKRRSKQVLSHQDEILVGRSKLIFLFYDEDANQDDQQRVRETLEAYQRLHAFAERLMGRYKIPEMLRELMDAVIEVTGAQKGFLLLTGSDGPRVTVARSADGRDIEDAKEMVSDSIVQRVLKDRRPLVIADALNDSEFNASLSILSLRLCSVMCVPLMDRGSLIGLLYVGHDNVVNLFDPSSLDMLTIFAAHASLFVQNALLVDALQTDNRALRDELRSKKFGEILGSSEAMRSIFRKVEKVAGTGISVLITGETGTGKELIARELHRRSPRANGPWVTVNCGAIPENLLESELFGHVRGAFTGAYRDKKGRFQVASGGTIFLDEVGELPSSLQVKLLRVLQEKTVTRVGGNRPEAVDIRVVAATNRDLDEEIREGRFREDLYYRLNVVALALPPLRERGDDVVLIARFLLDRYNSEFGRRVKGFTNDTAIALRKYHWPGNIRQLENRLKKAVVLAERPLLSPEDLDLTPEFLQPVMTLADAKDQFQRRYINEVLERNQGNRTKTARDLGVDPRTVFRHLEREAARD